MEKLKKVEMWLIDVIEFFFDGFVFYDEDDWLVMCNSKYKEFYN